MIRKKIAPITCGRMRSAYEIAMYSLGLGITSRQTPRITTSFTLRLAVSLTMYPSNTKEAKRLQSREIRKRRRQAGMTEIILVLPKERVAELDAVKISRGLRSRGQVVEELLQAGRFADQQSA
jgi:hypothetical protein